MEELQGIDPTASEGVSSVVSGSEETRQNFGSMDECARATTSGEGVFNCTDTNSGTWPQRNSQCRSSSALSKHGIKVGQRIANDAIKQPLTSLSRKKKEQIEQRETVKRMVSTAPYRISASLAAYKPPTKLPRRIVREDDYVEGLTHIIERDFYPDLHRLRATKRIIESHDGTPLNAAEIYRSIPTPVRKDSARNATPLSESQTPGLSDLGSSSFVSGASDSKYASHTSALPRQNEETSSILNSPAPSSSLASSASLYSTNKRNRSIRYVRNSSGQIIRIKRNMPLNAFIAEYTSEDNAEFHQILSRDLIAKRKKCQWMLTQQSEHNCRELSHLNESLKTAHADSMPPPAPMHRRPASVSGNLHEARNSLMFTPEQYDPARSIISSTGTSISVDTEMSRQDAPTAIVRAGGEAQAILACRESLQKSVRHTNTRFSTMHQLSHQNLAQQKLKHLTRHDELKASKDRDELIARGTFEAVDQNRIAPLDAFGVPARGADQVGASYHYVDSLDIVRTTDPYSLSNLLGSRTLSGPQFCFQEPRNREYVAEHLHRSKKKRVESHSSGIKTEPHSSLYAKSAKLRDLYGKSPLVREVLKKHKREKIISEGDRQLKASYSRKKSSTRSSRLSSTLSTLNANTTQTITSKKHRQTESKPHSINTAVSGGCKFNASISQTTTGAAGATSLTDDLLHI